MWPKESKNVASYIPDGYSRDGFIAAAIPEESGERMYDSLEFVYRPATRIDCARSDAEVAAALKKDFDPEAAVKAERLISKFVADHLVSWDLKNGVHPVAASAAACERLQPFLFSHLLRIIRGVQVSDKKPDETAPQKTDEELAKNSETVSG